jgi:hypothetical protein
MKEKILSLGKLLVEELESEPRTDTLSRWMAHYIAEKIVIVKNAIGKKKKDAEKQCFDTILKLWKHRAYIKDGQRPFENYETIFRALERLNPENKQPYYYTEMQKEKSKEKNLITKKVQKWLDMASAIDQAARVWIETVFNQAANSAVDERTKKYIQNAIGVDDSSDTRVILKLMHEDLNNKEKDVLEKLQKEKRERLRSRIKQLEAFSKINDELLRVFKNEL